MCCCNCCYNRILIIAMTTFTLVISAIAFLGPWWIRVYGDSAAFVTDDEKGDVFMYGLWGYCTNGTSIEQCHMWPEEVYSEGFVAWFYTCIALFGLGFLLVLLALPVIITAVCRPPAKVLHNVGGFSLICAGIVKLVAVLGFGVFTFSHMGLLDFLEDGVETIYFGFVLAFFAGVFAFSIGITVAKRSRAAKEMIV